MRFNIVLALSLPFFAATQGALNAEVSVLDGQWQSPFRGALAGKWLLFRNGDHLTLTGTGVIRVRLEVETWFGRGRIPPLCFDKISGVLLHVASGGGRRVDDTFPDNPSRSMLGRPDIGYSEVPAGQYHQWLNEYFYIDGLARLSLKEGGRFAHINYGVSISTKQEMLDDVNAPNDKRSGRVRPGQLRNTSLKPGPQSASCVESGQ